jgi:EpsI family protein
LPKFLNSAPARVLTLLLILQGVVILYISSRHETVPPSQPLAEFPKSLGAWQFASEGVVDQDSLDVLKADDLLLREYKQPSTRQPATLFIAAFRSQRNGKSPHSPKNCLPGAGWTEESQEQYQLDVGASAPITVNRYVVQHADERRLVLYWYQSRDRVVASEYTAKYYVMVDAIKLNRTDTALVRVVVPILNGDADSATRIAADFVRSFFQPLHQYLPA